MQVQENPNTSNNQIPTTEQSVQNMRDMFTDRKRPDHSEALGIGYMGTLGTMGTQPTSDSLKELASKFGKKLK